MWQYIFRNPSTFADSRTSQRQWQVMQTSRNLIRPFPGHKSPALPEGMALWMTTLFFLILRYWRVEIPSLSVIIITINVVLCFRIQCQLYYEL